MALTKWSDYQANAPAKAQQLTQALMCIKGVGVNENYVLEADPVGGGLPIVTTPPIGSLQANAPVYSDHIGTPITTAAYVQIVASMAAQANFVSVFDSSGETLVLAIGAGGAEVNQFLIPPGGCDLPFLIPVGSRVSLKAITNNATTGYAVVNFLT